MKMNDTKGRSIDDITLIGNFKLFKQMYVFVEKLLRTSKALCPCINSHSISSALVYVHIIYLLSLLLLVAFAKRGRTGFR